MEGKSDVLGGAMMKMMTAGSGGTKKKPTATGLITGRYIQLVLTYIPIMDLTRFIPIERIQAIRQGFATIQSECGKIVDEKRRVLESEGYDAVGGAKDLITLLLKSNRGTEKKSFMTDSELAGQVTTLSVNTSTL